MNREPERIKGMVGRADILRVLAHGPLPGDLGRIFGYAPAPRQDRGPLSAKISLEETELLAPVSAFAGSLERFWYLHHREALAHSPETKGLRRLAPLTRRQQRLPEGRLDQGSFPGQVPKQKINWDRLVEDLAQLRPLNPEFVEANRPIAKSKKKSPQLDRFLAFLSMAQQADQSFVADCARLLSLPRRVEQAVWGHPDVSVAGSKLHLSLKAEARPRYQQALHEESLSLREKVLVLLERHHARSLPAFFAVELLQTKIFLSKQRLDWLEHFVLRCIRTWFHRSGEAPMQDYARQLLALFPQHLKGQYTWPSLLYGLAHRQELRQGAAIPAEYQAEWVAYMVATSSGPSPWLLVQEGEDIFLLNSPATGICLLKGSQIASLTLTADVLLLEQGHRIFTVPVQDGQALCSLPKETQSLVLQSQHERLVIRSCTRPSWAQVIGRSSKDLFVELLWLGKSHRLYWQNPQGAGKGRWKSYHHGPVDMDAFGLSASIGMAGKIMQRFRWIEAGRFMMGSPIDEPEREIWGKETLHEVHLSQGFWLAETTVSQELWQAVMGNNPAKFKQEAHPVENVTWLEVQEFLQQLNQRFPHLNARLPTEAEWEYACRAGSSSPFAFGSNISPEQVNYNGNYPYHQGTKGLHRGQTVVEYDLPCNAWGLYAMHGNVWEWCQDYWQDDLHTEAVRDPQGPASGDFRVVRGGSWFLGGKAVRAAVRGRFAPEVRNDRIGFRLARTTESP